MIQDIEAWEQRQFNMIYPPYFFGKMCVIIPCQNRARYLRTSLPYWLSQTYKRFEIVIVDYGSDDPVYHEISTIADRFKKQIDIEPTLDNRYQNYNRISLFRVEDVEQWNMSHALNYGIMHSTSDIISVAGCDTLPDSRYLETVAMLVSDTVIPSLWCGRITYPRKYWAQVNGYQELCQGWGYEDIDFRGRLSMGLKIKMMDLPRSYCPSIQHFDEEMRDNEGMYRNKRLCTDYIARYGYLGNYSQPPGGDKPIFFQDLSELVIYVATLSEPIAETTTVATHCCYGGFISNTQPFYIIPKSSDVLAFTDKIKNVTIDVKSTVVTKSIWDLFIEINEGTLISANF